MAIDPQIQYRLKIALLLLTATLCGIAIYSLPPIPQDLTYHLFADSRPCCSLNNYMDVLSNAPFVLLGVYGLYFVLKNSKSQCHFNHKSEVTVWGIFFLGSVFIGAGSAYYHLTPNNQTLIWDRLPMTISFMSLVEVLFCHIILFISCVFVCLIFIMLSCYDMFLIQIFSNLN